ncbi:hypothetical protein RQP46_004265 [Phenoliferia psychrophenolica]
MSHRTIILQPSSRPLVYPPEIVALIVEHLGDQSPLGLGRVDHRFRRNSQLFQAALIGPSWASAALSLLYSDLRLMWRASSGHKLLRAFEERPELLLRVRRVEVHVLSQFSLAVEMNDRGPFLDWGKARKEWDAGAGGEHRDTLNAATDPEDEDELFSSWAMDCEWDANEETIEEGPDGAWVRLEDDYEGVEVGRLAFWGLIASLPRLRHLTLEDIDYSAAKDVFFGGEEVYPGRALKALDSITFRSDSDRTNHNRTYPPVNALLNLLIGEALALLPHLLTLSLTKSPEEAYGVPLHNVRRGSYPSTFLEGLSASTLTSFTIGDIPSKHLLAALPPSLTSLAFKPRNGSRIPWLYEGLLDQLVRAVLPTKARLPNLVLLSFDCRLEKMAPDAIENLGWHLLNDSAEMFGPTKGLAEQEREERQLRREKLAADPSSRPLVYPPEIVALIVEALGDVSAIGHANVTAFKRNHHLVQAALIGPSWASAALSLLYSHLRVKWRASCGLKLLRALDERPELLLRIRRVEVSAPSREVMLNDIESRGPLLDWDVLEREWESGAGGHHRETITAATSAEEEYNLFTDKPTPVLDFAIAACDTLLSLTFEAPPIPRIPPPYRPSNLLIGEALTLLPHLQTLVISKSPTESLTLLGIENLADGHYPPSFLAALRSSTLTSFAIGDLPTTIGLAPCLRPHRQRNLAAMATTLRPSSRPLYYPPEIIAIIVGFLGDVPLITSESCALDEYRNDTLLQAALIGHSWAIPAISLLYSDLRLPWVASKGLVLLAALEARPENLERIRRVEVSMPTRDELSDDILASEGGDLVDMEELRREWDGVHPQEDDATDDDDDDNEEAFEDWSYDLVTVAAIARVDAGPDAPWVSGSSRRREGCRAFWHLVGSLPRLEHLAVQGIGFDVPVRDKPALVKVLQGLKSFAIVASTDQPKPPPLAALRDATNIRRLWASSQTLEPFDLTSNPTPFPHLQSFTPSADHVIDNISPEGIYPPRFLAALTTSSLTEFGIGDTPTVELLKALPPTLVSLTFDPHNDSHIPWIRDAMLNQIIQIVFSVKPRLPHLRFLSLTTNPGTGPRKPYLLSTDFPGSGWGEGKIEAAARRKKMAEDVGVFLHIGGKSAA